MATGRELIEYARKCYEADNREMGLTNLLHPKIRHLRFIDGMEVAVSGTLPRVAVPPKYAEDLRKDAFKYRRAKTLIYAALPIVGCGSGDRRLPTSVCAPLVFMTAGFSESQGAIFVEPDIDELRFNFSAIATIAEVTGADPPAVERFLMQLPELPWPRERIHALAAGLAELLPEVDFTPLSIFPQLVSASEVRRGAEEPGGSFQCLSASALALIPNSPESRGVLFELARLTDADRLSPSLRLALEAQGSGRSTPARATLPMTPSVLSAAQLRALDSSAEQPLTLVVGPPGTGKSHTIASIALDHLARQQTVLIASRMDQAVNVVANKIEALIGPTDAIVRAGRKQHMRELKAKLENLLQGISGSQPAAITGAAMSARALRRQLRKLDRRLARLESSVARQLQQEIAWGELEVLPPCGMFGRLSQTWMKRWRSWQLEGQDAWQSLELYESLLEQRGEWSRQFLVQTLAERLQHLLSKRRDDLVKFLQAIRARSGSKQHSLFSEIDFSVLLHAFPVWLCKLTDLANVLPLERQLFDVAIIDEATQCDIASCWPLFQRARRVVVVGDPKQLRHISFLSESRQLALAEECHLDAQQQTRFHFRNQSILDAVSDSIQNQQQVVFLNEHFRSLPGIIDFSNREFYAGNLAIMRGGPDASRQACVQVKHVDGERAANGTNEREAEMLVADVVAKIQSQASLPAEQCESLGILSPLRNQVDLLAAILDRRLSYEQLTRHDVLVGTAHTFQGEERDVMFLSMAIDDRAHATTLRFLNTPNLLNVAITRARHMQCVYASFDPDQLDKRSLLHRFLTEAMSSGDEPQSVPGSNDLFRADVVSELQALGLQTWADYRMAGTTLDLIVESRSGCLGLDLVGYPGQLAAAHSLERYRMLRRAGLRVHPLSYRDWQQRRQAVLARLTALLGA